MRSYRKPRTSVFVIVTACVAAVGCSIFGPSHPSDAELERVWSDRETQFATLIEMAQADSHLVRIADKFTWLADDVSWPRPKEKIGLTDARWDAYRDLFRRLGITAGLSRNLDAPEVVFLWVSTRGMVTASTSKGYAYSESDLSPQVSSLDSPDIAGQHHGTLYKHIRGPWYLCYQWGG